MEPIYQDTRTRYFGPGLPSAGVAEAEQAYELGLLAARAAALQNEGWTGGITALDIAADYDALVRIVAKATDAFIAANGTLLAMVERELRRGGGKDEQPDAVQERIREREADEDHARQIVEASEINAALGVAS